MTVELGKAINKTLQLYKNLTFTLAFPFFLFCATPNLGILKFRLAVLHVISGFNT